MILHAPQTADLRKIKNGKPFPTWIRRFKPAIAQTFSYDSVFKFKKQWILYTYCFHIFLQNNVLLLALFFIKTEFQYTVY